MATRRTTIKELKARVEELEGVVHSLRAQVEELVGVCSSKCRGSVTREVLGSTEGDKVDRKLIAEEERGAVRTRATRRESSETREAFSGAERVELDREPVVEERESREEGAGDVDGTVTGKQDSKDESNKGVWRKAKSGGRQDLAMSNSRASPVSLENRFSILTSVDDNGKEEVDTLVIGDSRVRPLRRAFGGGKDRCVVKPGARVADVDSAVGTELGRYSPNRVVVHVGVNNIGPRASVKIVKEYHSLLQRLSETRKPVYITGVLPRIWASSEWYSRALALNCSVRQMCADMGLHYVDLWDEFYGSNRYYLRDGLHLSDEGARVLAAKYRSAFQGN